MPAARRNAPAAPSIPMASIPADPPPPLAGTGSGRTSTTFSDRPRAASTCSDGRPARTTTVDGLRLTRPMITPRLPPRRQAGHPCAAREVPLSASGMRAGDDTAGVPYGRDFATVEALRVIVVEERVPMKLPSVEYEAPTTVDEAAVLLAEHQDEASVLAGGQSLIPLLALRLARPEVLVDINGVAELSGMSRVNGTLAVGAMTREYMAEESAAVAQTVPLLAAALPLIGHEAIRNRGTIGGSLAHAHP